MAREDRTEEAPARVPVRKRVRQLLSQLGPARLIATLLFLLMAVLVARLGWQLPLVRDAERALYDARATAMAPHVGPDRRIDRKSVGKGKSVSGRVALGGRRYLQKKKQQEKH